MSARSREIDALRAVAMTAVIATHCSILPFGWTGVWLFFAISGYVVTSALLQRNEPGQGLQQFTAFFRRRAIRILPVYYLYISIGMIVIAAVGEKTSPWNIAALYLFAHNIAMIAGIGETQAWHIGHLWTISVEMQFYLLYGLAFCFLARRHVIAVLAAMVIAAPLLRGIAAAWLARLGWQPDVISFAIYSGPGLHVDSFAMGALLAFQREPARIARPLFLTGLGLFLLYCLTFATVNAVMLGRHGIDIVRDVISGVVYGQYREIFAYTALGLVSTGLVALAATRDRWIRWFAGNPLMQWIGLISYGGYVYHTTAIRIVGTALGSAGLSSTNPILQGITLFLVSTAVTVAIASVSYRYFEQPLSRALQTRRQGVTA